MSQPKGKLPMHEMAERHRGLSPAVAAYYAEAARVCLDRHHQAPVDFAIESEAASLEVEASWERTDDRIRGAWANDTDATRDGAYTCVLAAVEVAQEMVAVRRAETRTGADYYVGHHGEGMDDLENCFRLEVSGVDAGSRDVVRQRLRTKLKQAAAGASNLPALAGVVGFKALVVALQTVHEE